MATKKAKEKNTEAIGAGAAVDTATPAKVYPPRNIKYIGRVVTDKTGKIVRHDHPITKTSGASRLILPSAKEQTEKRIFWHERAGEIVKLFPLLYKLVVKKGGKRRGAK